MPLTAQQIVLDACVIAKCPGYLSLGGRQLNLTLIDLCEHRNLKVNLVVSTINAGAFSNGPFNLETNYLRTYDLFYGVQGEAYFLDPMSLREYDQETQTPGIANYPYEWASDLSDVPNGNPGKLYIYPQSGTPLVMTHRYFIKRDEIVNPQTSTDIPWFEDQDYLVQATAMRLMRTTDDDRYATWVQDCEGLLRKHLFTEGDEQQVVKEVKLDPRRFRIKNSARPTKLDPF
jgi:hypothetical protein